MAILAASGVAAANTGVVADNATAPYSMDESIERLTHSQDSRAKTVYFEDPYAGICPQTTSFLYSFSDKIVLMTPMFLVSPYSRQGEEVESAEFVFANAKCRYVISMTKFVTKDGIESQLPLYRSTQLHDLIAKLTHLGAKPASGANSGLGGDDKTKENAPIVTEEGGHAIVHPDRIDPKGAGMSFAGISFENADSSKEFPGMIYFWPAEFYHVRCQRVGLSARQSRKMAVVFSN
jgi:hypothetical protein